MLQTAINYFYTNFALGLVMCAVIFAGLLFMSSRISLLTAAGIIVGSIMIGNYQTISTTLIGGAGGGN